MIREPQDTTSDQKGTALESSRQMLVENNVQNCSAPAHRPSCSSKLLTEIKEIYSQRDHYFYQYIR